MATFGVDIVKLKEWIGENLTGQREIARCRLAIRTPLLSGGIHRKTQGITLPYQQIP